MPLVFSLNDIREFEKLKTKVGYKADACAVHKEDKENIFKEIKMTDWETLASSRAWGALHEIICKLPFEY